MRFNVTFVNAALAAGRCSVRHVASRVRIIAWLAGMMGLAVGFCCATQMARAQAADQGGAGLTNGKPRHADSRCARSSSANPVATDPKIETVGDVTRLSFRLSRPVPATSLPLEGPDRLVIDLPEVNFQAPAQVGRRGAGPVTGYRFGLFAAGRSRIVIDLAEPVEVTRLASTDAPGGLAMLEIELRRTTRALFVAAVAAARVPRLEAPEMAAQAAAPTQTAQEQRKPVVVIDPGHGGIDPGAVTGAVTEKAIVLAFSLKLRELLAPDFRVVMTRDDDRFISLAERVKIARQNGADLFISIHADSLSQAQDVRGATIYTASERATDAESARLAARENEVDTLAGLDAPREDREDIADILLDLAKRETRLFSAQIAARLVQEMGGAVKLHRIPHRAAGFRVLAAPDVPSVLIELGYVSSAKDVELLTSDAWRREAAGAIRRAVARFFTLRNGRSAQGEAKPGLP